MVLSRACFLILSAHAEFIQVTWIHVPFGYVGGLLIGYFKNIKEL